MRLRWTFWDLSKEPGAPVIDVREEHAVHMNSSAVPMRIPVADENISQSFQRSLHDTFHVFPHAATLLRVNSRSSVSHEFTDGISEFHTWASRALRGERPQVVALGIAGSVGLLSAVALKASAQLFTTDPQAPTARAPGLRGFRGKNRRTEG